MNQVGNNFFKVGFEYFKNIFSFNFFDNFCCFNTLLKSS